MQQERVGQLICLLQVHTPMKSQYHYGSTAVKTVVSSIFHLKMSMESRGIIWCPFSDLDNVGKAMIEMAVIVSMLLLLVVIY